MPSGDVPRASRPLVVACSALLAAIASIRPCSAATRVDDDAAIEDAWRDALPVGGRWLPVEPVSGDRSLVVALDFALGRRSLRGAGAAAGRVEWSLGLTLSIPFDRLFGAGRPPRSRILDDGFGRGLSAHPEETMSSNRNSIAAFVLPVALAIAPAARGGDRKPRSRVVARAATVPSTPASLRLPASIAASARASAAVSASASSSASVGAPAPPAPRASPSLTPGVVGALVRAAWHHAGLDDDARLDDLGGRARSSAFAPEVRLRAYRATNAGASVYGTVDAADRSTLSDGVSTMIEARLIFRLDRAVFADEEVALERLRIERIELRQRVSARVVELLLAWLRARRAAEDAALLEPERELARDTATEAMLALDALTGGAATKLLERERAPLASP